MDSGDMGSGEMESKQMGRASVPADRFVIERGSRSDYEALSRFHYRAGPPATIAAVLRAVDHERSLLGGVLVVSMPTLNGGWRELAWPGRYAGCDRRELTARINRELRCISRVVIDPRVRGIGLAVKLVRAYLGAPLTPATEAIAQMGRVSPFFERAGMTAYPLPRQRRDARLADALFARGVGLGGLDATSALDPRVASELVRWARSSRMTAGLAEGPIEALAARASGALLDGGVAYAHTHDGLMLEADPPPRPRAAPDADALEHALTILLTRSERRAVLAQLGRRHADRRAALLRALGIEEATP